MTPSVGRVLSMKSFCKIYKQSGAYVQINIDLFQPFQHTTYSVGAVYFTVMNLPRLVRENVIIAGIIPGPDEPDGDMNSLLEPLVKESQTLWRGIEMAYQTI